ncbi:MAG TPA: NCS2 family permease [Vicinamibacteria bacterium]|jgi:AGZA family xanthine/uracil permease-like MFS transporter
MLARLERFFGVRECGSSLRAEAVAGITTYMALVYIVLVNPAVLAGAGMEAGAVMTATCLSAAFATTWMAIHANYPIALAPGMGHNFFFAITVCGPVAAGGLGYSWQAALAAVFVSGCVFLLGSFWGMRAHIITVVPAHLKTSIAVGIGLLIAVVGLRWSGLLVSRPGIYIGLGDLGSTPVLLSLFGLLVMAVLWVAGVSAAIVLGILATTVLGLLIGVVQFRGLVAWPPSMTSTFLALDFGSLFHHADFVSVVFVFFFVDLFDTVGTLIGVGQRAGFMVNGNLPRARQALMADAAGTVGGSLLGTSTVTSYVESAAGVAAGGKTGLTALVTAALLAGSIFFYPLVRTAGGSFDLGGGVVLYPVLAPALILVGAFMLQGIGEIDWHDRMQAVPAFLTIVMMPLTTSITEGIAFGFIATSFLYMAAGRPRAIHWGAHAIAACFLLRYLLT